MEEPVATATQPPARGRWNLSPTLRTSLGVIGLAFLIHLIPLFLPRNMPEQELAIARVTVDVQHRLRLLKPLKDHPKATGAELREAAELLLEGAPAEARELVEEAERRQPGQVETFLLRARLCWVERMERCVHEAFEQARRAAPGDARPDLLWADMREHDGDLATALEAVGRAWRKAPEETSIQLRYMRLLSETGHHTEADQVLQVVEPKLPPQQVLLERGQLRLKAGRYEEARQLFSKAVGEEPQSPLAHYNLGMAYFRLGNMDAAEEELRAADRINVADPRALAALCAMQVQAGQLEAARVTKMDLERRFHDRQELIRSACWMQP
jgi:tetratricopeptide (TPR) repeat protein